MKKIKFSILASLIIFMSPFGVFAQVIDTSIPLQVDTSGTPAVDVVVVTVDVPVDVTQSADTTLDTSVSPQSTDTNQVSAPDTSLQTTFDPHQTSVSGGNSTSTDTTTIDPNSTPIDVPIDSGSSTPIVVFPSPTIDTSNPTNVVITTPIDPNDPNQNVITTITQVVDTSVTVVETPLITTIEPDPEFTFTVQGNAIATKDKNKKIITATPNLYTDNNEGVIDVSGNCADKYFVVLLYKNPDDYDKSPTSFIFNKAFDCVGGSYKYSIKDLPPYLGDGKYYLLIGGQGDKGSWHPVTALVPIIINNEKND